MKKLSREQQRAIFAKGRKTYAVMKDRSLKRNKPNPVPKKYQSGEVEVNVGRLGEGYFSLGEKQQLRKARMIAEKYGEDVAVGELRAVQIKKQNTQKAISKRAKKLAKRIAGEFKGKKRVEYPKGFSPNAERK